MIRYTYSDTEPAIQRLQGGVLYPHGIELVDRFGDEEGKQYRFKWLKFPDRGQDIIDYNAFTEKYAEEIKAYLEKDIDLQHCTFRHPNWENLPIKEERETTGEVVDSIDPPQEVEDE